ncbi:MAG: beta-N-acetylhexosaminidase, partial [Clostridiales bacterium]|nr:beta-N-acetylhexosaminidase [Clostridiales bacterium]
SDRVKNPEGYSLFVSEEGVKIIASTQKGLFYARKTLEQLIMQYGNQLPYVSVIDEPRYEHRGFMLDCARHFWTVEEIKKMVEAAAMFKMNKFHWHLSDDQGFRIQIEKYPLLTGIGARRKGDNFGRILVNDKVHSGYYTKDQVKEIVDFCSERYIDVIPEIDMPGHITAVLAAYPEYSCFNERPEVANKNGIFKNVLCAGKEKTFRFVCDILEEIAELFPYEYIHIGSDEIKTANWKNCPHCQKKMAENDLVNEIQLQAYFENRVINFLKSKGKKTILWNDALYSGKIDDSATIQFWLDRKALWQKWANRGNRIIVSDFFHYYADYPFEMTPLKKTYEYNPSDNKALDEIGRRNIAGVEAAIWTEFIDNFEKLSFQCYPRFSAIAETGWTNPQRKNYIDFASRFVAVKEKLSEKGIEAADISFWQPDTKKRLKGTLGFAVKLIPKKER